MRVLCLVAFACFALLAPLTATAFEGTMAVTPQFQASCPLPPIGVTMNITRRDLLHSVQLVNLSDKTIVSYRLAWVLTDRDQPGSGAVFYGMLFESRLRPGEILETSAQGAGMAAAQQYFNSAGVSRGLLIAGTVYVKFEDETEWSYPLLQRKEFETDDTPVLREKVSPALQEMHRRIQERAEKGNPRAHTHEPERYSRPSIFESLMQLIRSWVDPETAHAQGQCWFIVCNPWPGQNCQKFVNQNGEEVCNAQPCFDPFNCNQQACTSIPWPCS